MKMLMKRWMGGWWVVYRPLLPSHASITPSLHPSIHPSLYQWNSTPHISTCALDERAATGTTTPPSPHATCSSRPLGTNISCRVSLRPECARRQLHGSGPVPRLPISRLLDPTGWPWLVSEGRGHAGATLFSSMGALFWGALDKPPYQS